MKVGGDSFSQDPFQQPLGAEIKRKKENWKRKWSQEEPPYSPTTGGLCSLKTKEKENKRGEGISLMVI